MVTIKHYVNCQGYIYKSLQLFVLYGPVAFREHPVYCSFKKSAILISLLKMYACWYGLYINLSILQLNTPQEILDYFFSCGIFVCDNSYIINHFKKSVCVYRKLSSNWSWFGEFCLFASKYPGKKAGKCVKNKIYFSISLNIYTNNNLSLATGAIMTVY